MKAKNNKKDNDWSWLWFIGVSIGALIIWSRTIQIGTYISKNCLPEGHGLSLGEIGDMYGSVNAIFSGLAFAGIIITILLQRKELKSQREELEDTRKEFEITRITNLIFKQLDRIDSTVSKLSFSHKGGHAITGIFSLQDINQEIKNSFPVDTKTFQLKDNEPPFIPINNHRLKIIELLKTVVISKQIIDNLISTTEIGEVEEGKLNSIFIQNLENEIIDLARYCDFIYGIYIEADFMGNPNVRIQAEVRQLKDYSSAIINFIK
ncbi:MAG: hypothetical protein IPN76_31390 [Saprospiraceae bacterium]|nr:hypothetical protein [Saprospiraceae bacterium]